MDKNSFAEIIGSMGADEKINCGNGFPKTAFLLGAGLGTRLRPLTENCPKPLLPIGGKPMICHAMDALIALGIKRFIINTHHAAAVYKEKFPDGNYRGVPVTLVHEPSCGGNNVALVGACPACVPWLHSTVRGRKKTLGLCPGPRPLTEPHGEEGCPGASQRLHSPTPEVVHVHLQ